MTPSDHLIDIQSTPDQRGLTIDRVGIRDLRLPARITDSDDRVTSTVVDAAATVALPPQQRGTHMSRLVAVLEETTRDLCLTDLPQSLDRMLKALEADRGAIELRFPWFVQKEAPVTRVSSFMDITAGFEVSRNASGDLQVEQEVRVPVTTLCPCSRAISRYGAHNQRSEVLVMAEVTEPVPLRDVVGLIESQASCELYGMLKRQDEKYVTERAYERPKFVEDMVRDVFAVVSRHSRVKRLRVTCENFESIHNHSAIATIEGEPASVQQA